MVPPLRRHVTTLIAALKNLVLSGYAPEHDVHGIVDPFLQVEILRVLRLLGKGHSETSDQMNDILAQVATNTESAKNAGNAILYECVQTIMAIEVESGLRVLAINILGRFLINRDNNIRYVALNTLHKVVASDPQAVQRHRNTIVDCLKDADSSIRQRALELVYALVNEANIKVLVKELLSYLMACDVEFKDELTQRICYVVEKYSTDFEWHVDTIIQTLSVSNTFESEETVCSMISLVTSNPDLQEYATNKLYSTLVAKTAQPVLLQLAIWCVGEYGELLLRPQSDGTPPPTPTAVVSLLSAVLRSPVAELNTKEYVLNALMKLTTRFGNDAAAMAAIQQMLAATSASMSLEMQQRSVEYSSLLKMDGVRKGVLERMPAFEKKKRGPPEGMDSRGMMGDDIDERPSSSPAVHMQTLPSAAPAAAPENDLLSDLMGLGLGEAPAPAPSPMGGAPPPPAAAGGMDSMLMDMLGGGAPAPAPAGAPPGGMGGGLMDVMGGGMMGGAAPNPAFQAYSKDGLTIQFTCTKDANPSVTIVDAAFSNAQGSPMTGFSFQARAVAAAPPLPLPLSPTPHISSPPTHGPRPSPPVPNAPCPSHAWALLGAGGGAEVHEAADEPRLQRYAAAHELGRGHAAVQAGQLAARPEATPREAQDRLHLQRPAHVGDGAGRKLPRRLLRRVRGTAAPCKTRRALSRRLRRAGADGAWGVITRGAFSRRLMRWARRGGSVHCVGTPATVNVCGSVGFLSGRGVTVRRN